MNWLQLLKRIGAFFVLTLMMTLLFMVGATYFGPQITDKLAAEDASAAGVAMLIVCIVDTGLLATFILSARIYGWRLMLSTALLYYGVKTFQASIEAAYFMHNVTPAMAPRLFSMTLPLAFVWPPLAVWLLGKRCPPAGTATVPSRLPTASGGTWLWKLLLLGGVLYPLLFFAFGYYVAWQNPDLRAFYQGSDPGSFLLQMRNVLSGDPFVLLFEVLRGLLWAGLAVLLLWATNARPRLAILLLALIFALLENDTHLIPNPLMPSIVRQVHFIETASSNFLYGLLAGAVLLWHPKAGHTTRAIGRAVVGMSAWR
ncbi:MAG: hypothetical protein U0175_28430 [Caldilineaceae bacterium]